jgi:tetratricopeptide (TPR) repeat protein
MTAVAGYDAAMRRIALMALLALSCARALPPGAVQTVVDRAHDGKRVIFVGLDGADWRLLDRFLADGTMPRLARLVAQGERRTLLTQHPPLSPLVWTSMMTGVSPLEHRILDFTRFDPVTRAQEPITSDERAVPAIWNMARAGGKQAMVFGLWATYPAEEGIALTDRDLPRDYLAATELVHRTALQKIAAGKPDLAIVYFQGTDEIGHFTAGDATRAVAYFRRIDAILGEYQELAKKLDAQLILASDHGFDWGGTHQESSTATATAAKWHRNEGIYLRWPADATRAEDASVNQICATLLNILGLPRGEGLAPAIGETANPQSVNYRRYFIRARPTRSTNPSTEQVAKLKALGYLASTAPAPANATTTRTPASFNNEGLLLREAQRTEDAASAFREALRLDPQYPSARTNLDDLLAGRAIERLRARDCAGALHDLQEMHAQSELRWASIAAAEGCLGHDDAAEAAVHRSLALDPNQPELRRLVAGN